MDPRLYQALKNGDIASLKRLLQENPRCLHGMTAQKNTALHIAASLDYSWSVPEFCEIFNRHPYSQFAVNSKGDTPLHCAARAGQSFVANFLISSAKGVHLHEMRNELGDTPLHEAARNCHSGIASELMKADLQLAEILNEHGESALYVAADRGAVQIVRMLLQFLTCAVAGPNGQTALHAAVCRNYGNNDLCTLQETSL